MAAPASGPTVVRKQLGRRLREAREACRKSLDDVALTGVVSRSTLQRMERGEHVVNPAKVLELCTMVYGLDQPTTQGLYNLAIGTRGQGWWDDLLKPSSSLRLFLGLESSASVIRCFEADIVPGLLQTIDYARAIEQAVLPPRSPEARDSNVALRMKRQETLFGRTPSVQLHVVLGAGVLSRQVGGVEVAAAQLAHLRDLDARGMAQIRVLTWDLGAHAAMTGGFIQMMYGTSDHPTVVYVPVEVGGSYFEQPAQVQRYSDVFDSIWAQSTPLKEYIP